MSLTKSRRRDELDKVIHYQGDNWPRHQDRYLNSLNKRRLGRHFRVKANGRNPKHQYLKSKDTYNWEYRCI